MKPGDEITLTPTELVAGGDALAKLDGYPVFVSNVFPGDVALVRLTDVKKGFAKGELVRVLEPGPQRRLEPCPIAEECGGCDWTALRLDHQLEAKRRILTESLRRIGKVDPATLPPISIHPSPLNYRLRSRLHRDPVTGHLGFYAMRSNRVVPLSSACEVVGVETARRYGLDRAEEIAPAVAGSAPRGPRDSDDPDGVAGPQDTEIWEVDGELRDAPETQLRVTVGRWTFRIPHGGFFQVNRHLLGTMLRLVEAHAKQTKSKKLAVDLYAGVGFFTAPIAEIFEKVVAVEASPVSARVARKNIPEHVAFIAAPVEERLHRLRGADFVFLDPPRAGARQDVIHAVAQETRERICYLSCDPVTFARDASRLIASGWRLSSLDLLDLFPNTHHLETLSSFERAG